jgi:hypothetical protein
MKIVFLDIDGVLCTNKSVKEPKLPFPDDFHMPFRTGWDRLDQECITRLNKITKESGAKIVISSSWRVSCENDRQFKYLTDYLYSEGVEAEIIDKTPTHYPEHESPWGVGERITNRKIEIQQWLKYTSEAIESFIILDDDHDMDNLSSSHICTDESIGIQDYDVEKAIRILNE